MSRVKAGAAVAMLAFAMSGCGSSGSDSSGAADMGASESGSGDAYPSEIREEFTSSCASSAASSGGGAEVDYRDMCECVLAKIESQYTLAEFVAAEQAMASGEGSGLDMQSLLDGCI